MDVTDKRDRARRKVQMHASRAGYALSTRHDGTESGGRVAVGVEPNVGGRTYPRRNQREGREMPLWTKCVKVIVCAFIGWVRGVQVVRMAAELAEATRHAASHYRADLAARLTPWRSLGRNLRGKDARGLTSPQGFRQTGGSIAMNNRDTILSAQFPPNTAADPFLELDLREIYTDTRLGRRGKLEVKTKLVFKAGDEYRKDQSVFDLWADMRVQGQDGMQWSLGRAVIPEPVFFGPGSPGGGHRDPWTRAIDRLTLDVDHRQLDEIEQKRRGGPLTFIFLIDGTVQHGGRIGRLYADNPQLSYDVSASDWIKLLAQLEYGRYVMIEIPLTGPKGLTGDVQKAAQALQQAQAAFLRGDYEEAVADCRPGIDALEQADKGKFSLKPGDPSASKDERFHWLQRSLLSLTHVAHHPNDPALAAVEGGRSRWERADAEAAIAILAALIRRRIG